jgi:hypothetical protein
MLIMDNTSSNSLNKQNGISNTLVLTIVVILSLVVAYAWLTSRSPEQEVQSGIPEVEPVRPVIERPIELTPLPEPSEELARSYQLQGQLPALSTSDEPFKAHLRLLAGSLPVSWLNGDQILQKIVVQVDNMSRGELVYQHSPLVAPSGSLSVLETEEEGVYLLDTSSYTRYNLYADFLTNLDQELLQAFYRYYEPLLDQAYIRLGNEPGSFRQTLAGALQVVMAVPTVEGPIRLTRPLLSYEFEDPELENLSMVDKQLMRMGPENTAKIQSSLQPLLELISR